MFVTPRGFGAPFRLLLALAWLVAACGAAPPPTPAATPASDGQAVSRPATPSLRPAPTANISQAPSPPPAVAATASASAPVAASGPGLVPAGTTETAVVVRVVDGDTIVVDRGYGPERLRYIGVDTPETVDPRRPVEWMGREASAANANLVEGREVVLESDVSDRDRYDRLLRYVWLHEGGTWTLVNLELIRLGFAQVVTYPPDVRYVDLYLAAQAEAREAGRGLWGAEPPGPAAPVVPSPSAAGGGDRSGCEPAYPGVCIAAAPPDLDCGDVPFRRFEVLPPDPHRFDGDGDGIGCESD